MSMVDPIHLCPRCETIRTPRSRHCSTCNQCVERYDHHCPWINNCVGQQNHGIFMLFLTSLTGSIVSVYTFTVIDLLYWRSEEVEITEHELSYCILPVDVHTNKTVF